MPPLKIKYDEGKFMVSDGRHEQPLKEFLATVNHCEICNKIIPDEQQRCQVCEEAYPCDKCPNKTTDNCLCNKWKNWFTLQWAQFCQIPEKSTQKTPSKG